MPRLRGSRPRRRSDAQRPEILIEFGRHGRIPPGARPGHPVARRLLLCRSDQRSSLKLLIVIEALPPHSLAHSRAKLVPRRATLTSYVLALRTVKAMIEPTNIVLDWRGPISIASLPKCAAEQERLARPGIYVWVREYGEKRRVYGGKASDFLWRMREHLAAVLGGLYELCDAEGNVRHESGWSSGFSYYGDFDVNLTVAAAEVTRSRFYVAECEIDALRDAESFLIARLKELEHRGAITCANRPRVSAIGRFKISGMRNAPAFLL
jgi:hypothetical protein